MYHLRHHLFNLKRLKKSFDETTYSDPIFSTSQIDVDDDQPGHSQSASLSTTISAQLNHRRYLLVIRAKVRKEVNQII